VSGRSLVVRFESLDAVERALTATHDEIVSRLDEVLAQVDTELGGWSATTASRAVEIQYQRHLRESVDRLCRALADVRDALTRVRADAHDTEVRNVAVIG